MSGIRFTHIDHCSVIITDVARSRAFYGGVLGLKEIPAPKEFDFVAIWYDLGGTYLHLLLKPQPDTISPRHVCLLTPDAKGARSVLTRLGVPIEETVKIAAADRFFVRDPDGNRIEILQWVRPYNPEIDGRYPV
jgi:catechol 2,3-dioxygenase-like lactoylglutathione lyase family enzyme